MQLELTLSQGMAVYDLRPDPGDDPTLELARIKKVLRDEADLTKRTVLNLAALEFVDSTGIGALVGTMRQFREAGGWLILAGLQPRVVDTFRMLNLDRVLPYRITVAQALVELRRMPQLSEKQLLQGNPAPEAIRQWHQANAAPKEPLGIAATIPVTPAPAEDERQPQLAKAALEAAVGSAHEDWTMALALLAEARRLSARRGLSLPLNSTFEQWLSHLADAILSDEGRGESG